LVEKFSSIASPQLLSGGFDSEKKTCRISPAVPTFEVLLDRSGHAEVRFAELTDVDVGSVLQIDDADWVVVAKEAAQQVGTASRLVCRPAADPI
jgi:hypothetical protein